MTEKILLEMNGTVEQIVYRNEKNQYTVLEMNNGEELVTVVGCMPFLSVGEELHVIGTWGSHPSFGPQFKAQICERSRPATAAAMLKYLSSGAVKGIGPAMAARLVEKFGENVLKVLEEDPERLSAVRGISREKAKKIAEEFRRVHNGFLEKRMKAAQNAAHANFGAQKTQLRARRGELQVVNAHEFEALRVDNLLVEQIAGKQDFIGLQITEANVVRLGIKTNFVFRKTVDVLTPTNHERRAAGAFKRQRSNAWKHLARGNSEIRHNTELFSRRIVYGITQHVGQVEQSLPPLEQCGLRPTKESGGPQG